MLWNITNINQSGKKRNSKKHLTEKKFVFYENKHISKSLLGVFFSLPNIDGLARLIEQIKSHPDITDVNPIIWNDINQIDFPENLIFSTQIVLNKKVVKKDQTKLENKRDEMLNFTKEKQPYVFNKIDLTITKILVEKARTPFSKIAKQIGISTNNVISRYKNLRKENVISNSSITINLKKLGYKAIVILFLKASATSNASLLYKQFIHKSNVIVAIRLIGPFDVMINIPVRSFSELFELKEKTQQIDGIENIIIEIHAPFEKWPLNVFVPLLKNY